MRHSNKQKQLIFQREDEAGVKLVGVFRVAVVTLLFILILGIGWFSESEGAISEIDSPLSEVNIAMLMEMHNNTVIGGVYEQDVQLCLESASVYETDRIREAHSDGGYFYYESRPLTDTDPRDINIAIAPYLQAWH